MMVKKADMSRAGSSEPLQSPIPVRGQGQEEEIQSAAMVNPVTITAADWDEMRQGQVVGRVSKMSILGGGVHRDWCEMISGSQ